MDTKEIYRRWFGMFRLILLVTGISACAQMAPGSSLGVKEPIDISYSGLSAELMTAFPNVFRMSRYYRNLDAKTEKRHIDENGVIPIGYAGIHLRDLCNRWKNPNCKGMAFGEELDAAPQVLADLTDWLTHICERLPVNITEKGRYYSVDERQKTLNNLRKFMGCDGAPKKPRDIHIYVIRNFDDVFNGDTEHTDAVLRQSVVSERIVVINPAD